MLRVILALTICALVAGCATNERVNEFEICTRNGFNNFPVRSVAQNYWVNEYFQQQDGMTCTRIPSGFYNAGGMECVPNMQTYKRQVQRTRQVDGNESQRSDFISKCTDRQCLIKYGNTSCKK
jgi:hypothetical protein